MTFRAPLYTRIEAPKPRPWHTWSMPLQIQGQDQFFGDAGQVRTYDLANPRGRIYPVELRSWTQNLLFTTLSPPAAPPFAQYDWPNPRGKQAAADLRTWIDPLKTNLFGQDQIYGAPGMVPSYDYPNPKGKPYSIELRTWAGNLLPTTLSVIQSVPLNQYDWPNPRGKQSAITQRTWIDPLKLNLYGQDQMYGPPGMVPDYDYPNPKGKPYPIALRSWSSSSVLTTLAPQALPFNQYDWPVPKGKRGSISLRTWIDPTKLQLIGKDTQFAGPGQFRSYDCPNPRGKPYPLGLRSWYSQLPPGEIAVLPPTPGIDEPRRRRILVAKAERTTVISSPDRSTNIIRKTRTTLQ